MKTALSASIIVWFIIRWAKTGLRHISKPKAKAGEEVNAKKEHREAVILPDFSAHHLRHTFCTRLCEQETNLKVIQSIMGHKDIQTTMDVYAEATEQKKQESFERLSATLNVF